MKITTVGELRAALKYSEDEEPLIFDLEEAGIIGKRKYSLRCSGVGSSAGGRITVIYLDKPNVEEKEKVSHAAEERKEA